ncbi:hypothetical protein [Candidatus Sodalis pierantonius]|uniref:hypothetical protein n=1 Tax=Candidatus Sodalis pierantonii TaxID=1486991 RepID=UPI0009007308|nr:hypothetical protein [Candidatus Sodalis pierantonius]
MAKLPEKLVNIPSASLRQFVSNASRKPVSATMVHRVNITLTDEDLEKCEIFQAESGASRADIVRAALKALEDMPSSSRLELVSDVRKFSPKAGRPPVKK